VHADVRHIRALIDAAAAAGVEAVTHAITDGRDTDPHGGAAFVAELAAHADRVGTGAVATVVGRYLAMDRDRNWDRTAAAVAALTQEDAAPHTAASAAAAVQMAYDRGESDEFIAPTKVAGRPRIGDGDAVICANFRPDRMRQLVRMLCDIDPTWDGGDAPADLTVVTMTRYDPRFDFPVAFSADRPAMPLGAALAAAGRTQFRCAESEKYAHVTYFLNGGREDAVDGETRAIVDSPDVPTYDAMPAMAAAEVTAVTVDAIADGDPDVVVVNYANPDMVGHTGDFAATVTAVEAVDAALARLVDAMCDAGAVVCVTADHGNADEMGPPERPHTAHTTNRVPFVYLPAPGDARPHVLGADRSLCDIAPTVLRAADVPVPSTMTGVPIATPATDDAGS
jgi:phosphoglycerate mutase (EC 5.4.2.1)